MTPSLLGQLLDLEYRKEEGLMTELGRWSEAASAALLTVAVLLLALLIRTKAFQKPRYKLPPGPRGWPILGSLPLLGTLPNRSLFELSKQYGPLMFMRLGSINSLVVTSPKFAEEVLQTHDKIMCSRPQLIVPVQMFYNAAEIAFTSNVKQQQYLRKICTMGLLTASRISQFREIREREVIAILHFILEESQRGNAVNMTQCFSIISTNNMTQMIMNEGCYCVDVSSSQPCLPPRSTLLPECITELLALFLTPDIADFFPILKPFDLQGLHKRGKALHEKVDKFFEVIIEEHRQRRSTAHTENYKEDFVDALLGLGQTKGFEEPLSMDAVKGTLLDMIGGGSETSATTSVWALTEVLKNPRVLKKVQEELDGVVGPHRLVNEEDLPKLQYLNAVVNETMRLHPPNPLLIPHESSQDCEIEGFHIPARTRVFVNLWGIHRDPAVWERPLEFNPERFLNSKVDFRGRNFEFLPFGSGRRICPGINLGYLMVLYPLSVLLHALDWTLPDGQKPEELDMSETFKLVLERTLPLTVFGKARLPHHVLYPAQQTVK